MAVNFRTISKIALAQYDAGRMRLPGTADRLGVLRREMRKFHEYEGEMREAKRRWALARIEDTRQTLSRERMGISGEDRVHFHHMRSACKAIKTASYLALTVTVAQLLRQAAGGTTADIAMVLGAGAGSGVLIGALIDRLFGGTFDIAYKNIEKAILECKDAFSRP